MSDAAFMIRDLKEMYEPDPPLFIKCMIMNLQIQARKELSRPQTTDKEYEEILNSWQPGIYKKEGE